MAAGSWAPQCARNHTTTTDIQFSESGRESKRLIVADHLGYDIAGNNGATSQTTGAAQSAADALYMRWVELEAKLG
jgi:hypothetical protein